MKNIIPSDMRQEKRMHNPGKNNIFVGSRSGGPMEQSRTKLQSNRHENPEYFKRQSDMKHKDNNENIGRGIGKIGTRDLDSEIKKKDNIPARKDVPIQMNENHHQKNVGKDVGRGTGQVGRDQAGFQVKQFSKGRDLSL